MDELKSLCEDKSIIICRADKGNAVVLMNKKDYLNKMNTILSDKSRFKEIEHDNNVKNFEKFQNCLFYSKLPVFFKLLFRRANL